MPLDPTCPPSLVATAPRPSQTVALVSTPQDPPAPGGGETQRPSSGLSSMLVPLLLVFAIFYFVMIGPERKQRRKREAMLQAVKKGDKVMTTGGLFATVTAVQEDVITLQIADGVRARFTRASVQTVLEEGAGEGQASS